MPDDLIQRLKSLNLKGMATALTEILAERTRRPAAPEAWLGRLIDAEQADRQARSLRYQLAAARFPIRRGLALSHDQRYLRKNLADHHDKPELR